MHETRKRWVVVPLLMLLLSVYAQATPILGEWQDGNPYAFSGWASSSTPDFSVFIAQPLGGATLSDVYGVADAGVTVNGQSAISITGTSTAQDSDMFYTTAFGTLDLTEYAGFSFDFYSANNDPIQLGFYFRSSASIWYYMMDPIGVGSWDNYSGAFAYAGEWQGFGISGSDYTMITDDSLASTAFGTAIQSVTQIGFFIDYSWQDGGGASREYGIDDFGLTVPEPETYLALGMALLTVALVFRKNISESLAEARAMMLS